MITNLRFKNLLFLPVTVEHSKFIFKTFIETRATQLYLLISKEDRTQFGWYQSTTKSERNNNFFRQTLNKYIKGLRKSQKMTKISKIKSQ